MPRAPQPDLGGKFRDPKLAAAVAASFAIHGEAARMRQIRADYIGKYRLDFARWIEEVIRWDTDREDDAPTSYQLDAARALIEYTRVSMVGPHGLGKSAWFAWAVQWFATTRDGAAEFGFEGDWKIRTTAGSWRQLIDFLWPEIRTKWTNRLRWDLVGRPPWEVGKELIQTRIEGKSGQAAAAATTDPKLIEGAHANSILILLDESKAIPAGIFDAVEGALSGGGVSGKEAFAAAHSTPGDEHGRFYEFHTERDRFRHWHCIQVTFDMTVAAKRNAESWRADMARVYGIKNPVYINRVLGRFAKDRSDGVVPTSWVEAAMERWAEDGILINPLATSDVRRRGELTAIGVDPNDSGEDPAAIACLYGDWFAPIIEFRSDTDLAEGEDDPGVMALVDEVLQHTEGRRVRIVVDALGPGAGVYSRLRQIRKWGVVPFKASERPPTRPLSDRRAKHGELEDIDEFRNARAWMLWQVRKALDPDNPRKIALPPSKMLLGDLTEPRWWEGSNGAIEVDSKDDLRKKDRLGRSTNHGDALAQALVADYLGQRGSATTMNAPVNIGGLRPKEQGVTRASRWDDRRAPVVGRKSRYSI